MIDLLGNTHLHEVVLGLLHAGDVVEGNAGVGLHLELGLGLTELQRVVAADAARAAGAAAPPRQQEQAADQQQRERQVACIWPSVAM